MSRLVDALYRLGALGDGPDDSAEARLQHRFLLWMGLFMSCGGLVWGTLALAVGFGAAAVIPYGYVALTAANMAVFARTRRFERARRIQVGISLLLPVALQAVLGGFVASGAVVWWSVLALVGSLTFTEIRQGLQWLVAFVVLVVLLGVLDPWLQARGTTPPAVSVALFTLNVGFITSIVFGLTTYVLSIRKDDNAALVEANTTISALAGNLAAQVRRAEQAEADARAASAAKSAFLANMSHELRTPLNAILGYTELLLEEAPEGGGEELARIRTAGQHLLTMISDVLDLAKIEAGKMTVELAPVDADAVAREVVDALAPVARKGGNQLVVRSSGPAPILSDAARLRQILFNVVGNAVKFTRDGVITVEVTPLGEVLALRVIDTGVGMTPEQLARVRRPFEQADGSTTRRFGGTGLGLYLVERFVEMLGGTLALASVAGKGTTVTVTLPRPGAP